MKTFQARSRARAWCLHLLYAWEMSDRDSLTEFAEAALRLRRISPRYRPYLEVLVALADEHLAEIDGLLRDHIPNWRLERLAAIDRNILRLGVVELRYVKEIPGKVAITEAIRLAEQYGSDDSGAFVNGVLDSVYREAAIAG